MKLRTATINDADFLFELRNDPSVKQNSFSQQDFTFESHVEWFKKALSDGDRLLLIAEIDGSKAGQVRFDRDAAKDIAEVNIAVALPFRGRGIAQQMLVEGCREAFKQLGLKLIVAHVLPENSASISSFLKSGFVSKGEVEFRHFRCLELTLTP